MAGPEGQGRMTDNRDDIRWYDWVVLLLASLAMVYLARTMDCR